MVLIVLATAWAAFLLPQFLRGRSDHRPSGSITDFRRQLRVLARTTPAAGATFRPASAPSAGGRVVPFVRPGAPVAQTVRLGRSRRAVKRRRDVFVGLLVAMAGSLVLGALPPLRVLWSIHLLLDVLFAAYVGALLYVRNLEVERQVKVRFLPTAPPAEPALLYRRSAN